MISRAYIHLAGPAGAGKTTLGERILQESDFAIFVARCTLRGEVRRVRESRPARHPELRRYRAAGAEGAALLEFPPDPAAADDFFMTELMAGYSEAVLIEGDCPMEYVDLRVYVAPAPEDDAPLLVKEPPGRTADDLEADALERLLNEPDGIEHWLDQMLGANLASRKKARHEDVRRIREELLESIASWRRVPRRPGPARWSIAAPYAGIEHAQAVVVNVRSPEQRPRAERLLAELRRIRKDREVFDDVLGWRGKRIPITAVVADLSDPGDPGTRKILARIRRKITDESSQR